MKLDFPVMLATLLVAAAAQTLLPPLHGGALALKLPLLPAVALYYVLERQWPLGVLASLWAGILTDALGGVPPGTSSFGLLAVALAVFASRKYLPEAFWLVPALGAAATAFLILLQYVFLRARCGFDAPVHLLLRPLAVIAPLAALATAAMVAAARRIDLMAGNTEPRKEVPEP